MKFSIKNFFSKYDHIHSFLQIWSDLLKKFLMENFIFCAVNVLYNNYLNQPNEMFGQKYFCSLKKLRIFWINEFSQSYEKPDKPDCTLPKIIFSFFNVNQSDYTLPKRIFSFFYVNLHAKHQIYSLLNFEYTDDQGIL